MLDHLLANLGQIPAVAVYLFVLVWLAAESCGLPLPNEIVLLLVGSLAAQHRSGLSPIALVVVATLGSLAGASGAYAIGMRGGRAAVLRFGRYIRLDEQRLDSVEKWFASTGAVAIGIARITPFVRTVASFPAGMLRLPLRSFVVATLIGSLIWCTALVTLGDLLGANYTVALTLIQRFTIPAVIVLAALIGAYLWLHNRLSHTAPVSADEVAELEQREQRTTIPNEDR